MDECKPLESGREVQVAVAARDFFGNAYLRQDLALVLEAGAYTRTSWTST